MNLETGVSCRPQGVKIVPSPLPSMKKVDITEEQFRKRSGRVTPPCPEGGKQPTIATNNESETPEKWSTRVGK